MVENNGQLNELDSLVGFNSILNIMNFDKNERGAQTQKLIVEMLQHVLNNQKIIIERLDKINV